MSKFIRTAAEVVGVAVAIAAAIPSGGTSLLVAGLGAAGAGAAEAAAIGLTALSVLTAKKPVQLGNPEDWQSDPQAGIPHIGGRIYSGGQIILREVSGDNNIAQSIHTVYSTGPIKGFEALYVSSVATGVDADGNADIVDKGKLVVATQLGLQPEPSAFGFWDSTPGLSATSKLSGLAASAVRLYYDTKGAHTLTTEPQIGYVVLGTPVYDPRQDSTYPGGAANGTQRWNDETTWSFTGYDNPGLKALSFLIGYRQSGKLVIGPGIPLSSINVTQLVEMANVCDANGWKYGCSFSSTDDPWQVYTQILQAGGAVPSRTGTITGAIVNTPKVSLATFERDDIIGPWSIQATQARRDRINAIVPRYMAEQSLVDETTDANGNTVLQTTVSWGIVPAGVIVVDDYVTVDGEQRTKEVTYSYVTGVSTNGNAPNQVAQLARYDIENAREFGPISLPMKPRWMGYRAGDVITGGASLTELGLVGQDIMILQRQFSATNMTVTFTALSETAAKHAFALGQTTTAPPTPSLSGPPLVPTPGNSAWALTAGELTSTNGTTSAALYLTGTSDSSVIDAVIVEMRISTEEQDATANWEGVTTLAPSFDGTLTITNVQDLTAYQVAVSYRMGGNTGKRLILGPATAGQTAVPWSAGVVGPGKPADNADNTETVFVTAGLTPAQVVSDINLNASNLIQQALLNAQYNALVDARTLLNGQTIGTVVVANQAAQVAGDAAIVATLNLIGAKSGDGSSFVIDLETVQDSTGQSLAEKFSTITASNSTITATVNTLAQTYINPDGTAKALITLETSVVGSNGLAVVSGFTNSANSDGSSNFNILASTFSIVDDSTGTPFTPFAYANGVVSMSKVVVDTLEVNTAVVPVRATDASGTAGSFTGAQTTNYASIDAPVAISALTKTITMPVAGYIDVEGWGKLDLPSGNAPWRVALAVNGTTVAESTRGGNAPNDAFSMAGSVLVAAGTYTLTYLFSGHTTVTLSNKSMRANGYPATQAAS